MKFRRILIIVLSLFLILDAALILDEQFDLFNGTLITGLEFFKASTKEKITGSAGGVSEHLPKHLNQAASQKKVLPEEPDASSALSLSCAFFFGADFFGRSAISGLATKFNSASNFITLSDACAPTDIQCLTRSALTTKRS